MFNHCSQVLSLKLQLFPTNLILEVFLIHQTRLSLDICLYFSKTYLKHKLQPEQCRPWLPHSSTSLRYHILNQYSFFPVLFLCIRASNGYATSTVLQISSFFSSNIKSDLLWSVFIYHRIEKSHKILT